MKTNILLLLLTGFTLLGSATSAQQKKDDPWAPERINALRTTINNAVKAKTWTPEAQKAHDELAKLEDPGVSPNFGIFLGGKELNEGLAAFSKNDMAQAEGLFKKVLQLRESAYGQNDWLVVPPLSYLGLCYEKTARLDQAIDMYKRSTSIGQYTLQTRKLTDPRVPIEMVSQTLLHDLNAMAKILVKLGRAREAEIVCWQVLQLEKASIVGSNYRGQTNATYRDILRKTGRWSDSMTIIPQQPK